MAVEVDGAFGALVDDERIVVSWPYRQSEERSKPPTTIPLSACRPRRQQWPTRPKGRPLAGRSDSARLLAGLAQTGDLQAGPRLGDSRDWAAFSPRGGVALRLLRQSWRRRRRARGCPPASRSAANDPVEPELCGAQPGPPVADTGLSAALPLSLSARAKRNSDRRHHEARNDRSFVVAEATCVGCLGLAGAYL